MLEAWTYLHNREAHTAIGAAMSYSPSEWRRTTASPINPRSFSGSDRCFCHSVRARTA